MPVNLQFTIMGDIVLSRTIERRITMLTDFRPAWEEIIPIFTQAIEEHFNTEGSEEWQALSPKYAAWKEEHYPGKPIMRRTDALFDSLTKRPLGIERLSKLRMTIGTNVKYGIYHHKGGWVQGRPPQRKVVVLNEKVKEDMVKVMQKHLVYGERKSFGTPAWAPPERPVPRA